MSAEHMNISSLLIVVSVLLEHYVQVYISSFGLADIRFGEQRPPELLMFRQHHCAIFAVQQAQEVLVSLL